MLNVALRPSQRLARWLLLGNASAATSVLIVAIPWWLKIVLVLAVALSWGYSLAQQAWHLLPYSIVALQADREGGLVVKTRDGRELTVQVLPASSVAAFLTIIVFKPFEGGRTQAVLILPDSLPPELFRQLRVWLKWKVSTSPTTEPQTFTLAQS